MLSPKYIKQLKRVTAYQEVFNSAKGKEVLFDLMRSHHMMGSSFDKDHAEHARREGERNVVLRILSLLQVDAMDLANKYKQLQESEENYKE